MTPDTAHEIEVLVPEHGTLRFHGADLNATSRNGTLYITRAGSEPLAVIRDWVYWRVLTAEPEPGHAD